MTMRLSAYAALLATGAIFGFFYAWVCSTMWGLDAADPRVAIPAMQAMNTSVRNAVFAPAFFGTPLILVLAALLHWQGKAGRAALLFLGAAAVYLAAAFLPTVLVNVPMNEALGALEVPAAIDEASAIWSAYSAKWQMWNQIRTGMSGLALLLAGAALRAPARAA